MATLDLTSLGLERQRRLEELSKLYLGGQTTNLPPIESFMQIDEFGRTPAQVEQARKSALGVEQSILNLQSQQPQRPKGSIDFLEPATPFDTKQKTYNPQVPVNDPTGTIPFLTGVTEGAVGVGTGIIGATVGSARAISESLWGNIDVFMRTGSLSQPALEQTKGKNFYRSVLKNMEQTAQALQYEPESAVGKKTVELAMLIPQAIKTATDFTAKQAGRIGLGEDQQALLSFTLEALALYGADKGFRAAANKYKSTFAKAKTEFNKFDLNDPAAWERFQDLKEKFGLDPSLDQEFQQAKQRTYGRNSANNQTGGEAWYDKFDLNDPRVWQRIQELKAKFGVTPELDQILNNAREAQAQTPRTPNGIQRVGAESIPDVPLQKLLEDFNLRPVEGTTITEPPIPPPTEESLTPQIEIVPSSPQSTLSPEQQVQLKTGVNRAIDENTPQLWNDVRELIAPDIQSGLSILEALHRAGITGNTARRAVEMLTPRRETSVNTQSTVVQEVPNINQNTRNNLSQIIDIALNPNTPKDQRTAALQQIKSSLRENQPQKKSIDKIVDELGIKLTPEQRQELLPQLRNVRTPKVNPLGETVSKRFAAPQQFQEPLARISQEEGVDKSTLEALISHESNWNPNAVSDAGAQGLGQIMPKTQKEVGVTKPFDPVDNIRGAAKYLRKMLVEFNGNLELALAAYNAGPRRVKAAGNRIPEIAETQNYVKDVMDRIASLTGRKRVPTDTELFERTAGIKQPEITTPVASLSSEIDPSTINQPIVAKVQSVLKDSDRSSPLDLTPNEKVTFIHENTKPVGPVVLDEIAKALEGKIDISERLPENIRGHFKQLLDEQIKSQSSSEGRGFLQILSDAMDLILPESNPGSVTNRIRGNFTGNMPNEQGSIGRFGLSYRKRKAAQNLEQDARRNNTSIEEFLKSAGKTPEEIAIIQAYLRSVNNPMPEDGVNPRNMRLDPLMTTDKIVKQRKELNKTFVPVYGSESLAIQTARDIRAKNWWESFGDTFQNPFYIFRKAGLMDEIYYPYRTMERRFGREQKEMVDDIAKLKRVVNPESEKAIWAHGYSQDPDGRKLNTFAKVTPRQLTPGELEVYNTIRHVYDEYFLRINEVRRATGREELDSVPNYFTLSRAFSAMERRGLQPNLLLDSKSSINARFAEHMHTKFPYIFRTKAAYVPDYNGFNVLQTYLTSALRDIHRSPFIAKVHELIDTELPDINNPNRKFSLAENNPSLHKFLQEWNNFLAGKPNFSFEQLWPGSSGGKVLDILANRIRQNLSVSILTGLFSTMMNQFASLSKIANAAGPLNTGKAVASMIHDVVTGRELKNLDTKDSQIIDTRAMEATITDIQNSVRDFSLGKFQQSVGNFGFLGMQFFDMFNVRLARRAGMIRAQELGLTGREANRFADDVIVITQGSGMPGDLNSLQHNSAGKLASLFGTYSISDWNFLMQEVLNIRGQSKSRNTGVRGALVVILASAALTSLYEDVLGLKSPLPSPIRDLAKNLRISSDKEEDAMQTAMRASLGLMVSGLEQVPLLGTVKYGKGLGGPAISSTWDLARAAFGNQKPINIIEPISELSGFPLANFTFKTYRALKRGQSVPSSLLGIQQENLEEGVNPRSTDRGRSVGSRGR